MLDLFYVAVGCLVCSSFGPSQRPATSLKEKHGLCDCRSGFGRTFCLFDLRAPQTGALLKGLL